MTFRGAVLAGRRAAEANMVDGCTVETLGTPVTDADGAVTYPAVTVYAGKCRVQTFEGYQRLSEAAGALVTVQRYSVHVPVGAFVPAVGQRVTVTGAAHDVNLVGRRYRVVALLHKTAATAYRLGVEEWVDA